LIQRCVEDGVSIGVIRAYKHNEAPDPEKIGEHIQDAVMHEICEWFKFEEDEL
jgi:predicted Zn-dependent protease with MMP-like domain